MSRNRSAKIIATVGPASNTPERLARLYDAGADVFRLNFSHGEHADHEKVFHALRALEAERGEPIAVLADLQGPKFRIGRLSAAAIELADGQNVDFDLDEAPGDERRIPLPHPPLFEALRPGQMLLIDDGKLQLEVTSADKGHARTRVVAGGVLSARKGVNLPGAVLPVSALTAKDRKDLDFALDLGVDWIALSFVQRPDDIAELRKIVQGRAGVMAKLEKPAALDQLDEIIDLSDAVMVARGDLGVELPPEDVPAAQKRIVRACRQAGKPVVVATQMLDSMVDTPTPTRAEASDVANAVYEGADATMLSAESAAGAYPVESVAMMDRIIKRVENDATYRPIMDANHPDPHATAADAITAAARQVAHTLSAGAIVTYTTSGSTTLRAARERPAVPILCLTGNHAIARRMRLVWGVRSLFTHDATSVEEMVGHALATTKRMGLAAPGQPIVITAGMPFGTPGATNLLRIAWVR